MKSVLIILIMSGFAVPVAAQLGHRTLWEKPVGNPVTGEMPIGKPFSYQTADGGVLLSFLYRPCSVKCSTVVVSQKITPDSSLTLSINGRSPMTGNADYSPFKNNFFIQNGAYTDPQTNVLYHTTEVYDLNSDWKSIFKRTAYVPQVGLLDAMANGGYVISLHQNGFNLPDSILSIGRQGQAHWRYGMQSFLLNWQDSTYKYTGSDLPVYRNGQVAYIAKREIRSKADFSILISSVKRLVAVDSTGEKWSVTVDTTATPTHVIGQDDQARWVVLSAKDSTGILSKYGPNGQKTETLPLKLPSYYILNNVTFQSTPDNGFLLYRKNYVLPEIIKFDSDGQQKWRFSGIPYMNNLSVYPNGNILGCTQYYGAFRLFLLAPDGTSLFSDAVTHYLISDRGWVYFTTSEKLYAVNPQGEMAWTVQRPSSYAMLSQDVDGSLLMTETLSVTNPTASPFLKMFNLDVTNAYRLTKYSSAGKKIWQLPITLPIENKDRQVKILAGSYPVKDGKGEYLLTQLLLRLNPNEAIGNQNNVSHTLSFTKITRPCYENLNATLKSSAASLCEGQKLQLTSNTDSLHFLSYQWQRDGQTLATTRRSDFEVTTAGTYRVIVQDSVCGTSFTSSAIQIQPRAALQPQITATGATDFCEGTGTAVLTATALKQEAMYQWYRDGQPVPGAFQPVLSVTEAGRYRLSARDSVCKVNVLSPEVTVTVRPLPLATVTPEANGAVYAPFKAKLRANEGVGFTYQWFKEGTEIVGATGAVYEASESGSYAVRVSKEGCSRTSSALSITILQPLGTAPTEAEEVMVFPNPTRGEFELKLPSGRQTAEPECYDMTGRRLPLLRVGSRYRLEGPAGLYLIRVKIDDWDIKKRLIILH